MKLIGKAKTHDHRHSLAFSVPGEHWVYSPVFDLDGTAGIITPHGGSASGIIWWFCPLEDYERAGNGVYLRPRHAGRILRDSERAEFRRKEPTSDILAALPEIE